MSFARTRPIFALCPTQVRFYVSPGASPLGAGSNSQRAALRPNQVNGMRADFLALTVLMISCSLPKNKDRSIETNQSGAFGAGMQMALALLLASVSLLLLLQHTLFCCSCGLYGDAHTATVWACPGCSTRRRVAQSTVPHDDLMISSSDIAQAKLRPIILP